MANIFRENQEWEPCQAPPMETVERIVKILFRYQRSHSQNENESDLENYIKTHQEKVQYFMDHDKPVHFILPAFPAKSPNPNKVLGILPDMGEYLSLQFLKKLCDEIKAVYTYGAKITVCSDGRVFSDLVSVSDENVTKYSRGIQKIIQELDATCIETFNLDDIYDYADYNKMRDELVKLHGRSVDELKEDIKNDYSAQLLFNGIHKFLHEDLMSILSEEYTKSQIKKIAKERAYHVIIRSNAWSGLIEKIFPRALRLSIHPQFSFSKKIGIKLMDTDDVWRTPWHGVVLKEDSQYKLMTRAEVEALGAQLIYNNDQPSYYILNK